MKPEEIKPDTELCTIIGYNAQTGNRRRYFNKILKLSGLNATAIALNIKDEHFDFTMKNLANSKVTRMMIEPEFQAQAVGYCDELDERSKVRGLVGFVEVVDGKIMGYNLDVAIDDLVDNPKFYDENMILAVRMMLLANSWYNAQIDLDLVPTVIQK
jgi:shikimate 5-dehydrogenase